MREPGIIKEKEDENDKNKNAERDRDTKLDIGRATDVLSTP